jgi:mannosyl-oligosaccharide alpha-1,3-glucosidase
VTEVLDEEKLQHEIVEITTSLTEITMKSDSNKAVVKLSPLQIDFYRNEVLVVSINSKNLMKFEHLRMKPETLDENEDSESWEESFMGVIDTKMNGPEAVAVDFTFPQSEILFGIPEHADSFALKTTVGDEPYRLYNLDVANYEVNSRMALHGSIPVLYGHGNNQTAGVFWHNSADTFVDVHNTKTAHFISETGIIDVFVLLGPSPNKVFSQYTKLTGVGNLPQLHTLAYHQSRSSYMTQEEVIEVINGFDKSGFPLDTVWLDIEYTDEKKYFTWNRQTFPQPLEMMRKMNLTKRQLTVVINPHVKTDDDYNFYKENRNLGFFVKDKTGETYEGNCLPGLSSYVDFFNPEAQKHYADQYLLQNFVDSSADTGIWNDMNEPTVFGVPEKTMPKDNLHYGGVEHRNVHNLYGHMQVKGTFDGLMRRNNETERPFILTRSFFSGTQK